MRHSTRRGQALWRSLLVAIILAGFLPLHLFRIPPGPEGVPLYPFALAPMLVLGWVRLASPAVRQRLRPWVVGTLLAVTGLALSWATGAEMTGSTAVRRLAFFGIPVAVAAAWLGRKGDDRPFVALGLAAAIATLGGYVAYATGRGGAETEHALGYWGIHYLTSSRNSDAFFPLVGLLVSGAWALGRWSRARSSTALPLALAAFWFGGAVLLSQSRSAWLAAIAGVGALTVSALRDRVVTLQGLAAASAALLLVAASVPADVVRPLAERASTLYGGDAPSSNAERETVYRVALGEVARHPLGVGADGLTEALGKANVTTSWAENAYLQFAVETGWLGASVFVTFLAAPLVAQAQNRKRGVPGMTSDRAASALLVATGVFLLFNVETTNVFCWLVLSVAAVWAWDGRQDPGQATP